MSMLTRGCGPSGGNPLFGYNPSQIIDPVSSVSILGNGAQQMTAASSAYAGLPGVDAGDFDTTASYMACGWFYLDSVAASAVIFADYGASGSEDGPVVYLNGSALLIFEIRGAAGLNLGSISATTWYFWAIGWDLAATEQFGLVTSSATLPSWTTQTRAGPLTATTSDFTFGQSQGGIGYMDGRQDNVMFCNPPTSLSALRDTIAAAMHNIGNLYSVNSLTAAQKTAWGVPGGWDLDERT